MIIYKNTKRAGNWLALETGKHDLYFQWYVKLNLKHKQWFAYIKTPIFHLTKNNARFSTGLCFGKYYAGFGYHY